MRYARIYNNTHYGGHNARLRRARLHTHKGKSDKARQHFGFFTRAHVRVPTRSHALFVQQGGFQSRARHKSFDILRNYYRVAIAVYRFVRIYFPQKVRRREISRSYDCNHSFQLFVFGRAYTRSDFPRLAQRGGILHDVLSFHEPARLDFDIGDNHARQKIHKREENVYKPRNYFHRAFPALLY